MSNALMKQQEDFVKNTASKLKPNGGPYTNGTAVPSKPMTNGDAAGANVPLPDGVPQTDGVDQQDGVPNGQGVNGEAQPQSTLDAQENPNLFQKAVSDVHAVNKQALGTAHDVAHGVVGHIPGGDQASQFTHGLAQNFIPGTNGDRNGQSGIRF